MIAGVTGVVVGKALNLLFCMVSESELKVIKKKLEMLEGSQKSLSKSFSRMCQY